MLTRAHETETILSSVVLVSPEVEMTKPIGCVALRIEYFLRTFPITRST